jgi:hypothetical protein
MKIGYCIEFNAKPWIPDEKYKWPKIFKTEAQAWAHIEFVSEVLFGNFSKYDYRQKNYKQPCEEVSYFISCSVTSVKSK